MPKQYFLHNNTVIKQFLIDSYGICEYDIQLSYITDIDEALLYYKNISKNEYCLTCLYFKCFSNHEKSSDCDNFIKKLKLFIKILQYKIEFKIKNTQITYVLFEIFENILTRLESE